MGWLIKKGDLRFCITSDAWKVSLCFISLYIAATLWNYIQASLSSIFLSHHNYTIIVDKVGFLVYLAVLIIVCLGGSVMKVYIAGTVKKKGDFGF